MLHFRFQFITLSVVSTIYYRYKIGLFLFRGYTQYTLSEVRKLTKSISKISFMENRPLIIIDIKYI